MNFCGNMLYILDLATFLAAFYFVAIADVKVVEYATSINSDLRISSNVYGLVSHTATAGAVLCEQMETCWAFNINSNGSCELVIHSQDDKPVRSVSEDGWNIYIKRPAHCWPSDDYDGIVRDGMCYFWKRQGVKEWRDSLDDCRVHGADLVCIESAEENNALATIIPMQEFWIGHNRRLSDGYECNGTTHAYMNSMAMDEPHDCVVASFLDTKLVWNGQPCVAKVEYVCEKKFTLKYVL